MTGSAGSVGAADSGPVQLAVPADPAYVSVLRAVTAALAARRDFTLDEIDDLRLIVDEASSLLLLHARSGARLTATFDGPPDALHVDVALSLAGAPGRIQLDEASFAWTVLLALADTVTTELRGQEFVVSLTRRRAARET